MSKIRIKDIAKLANVSSGTVDRVIHGRSGVSETTRKRVQDIIDEYDYQPDILAGVLANNRNYKFLVCMPKIVSAHEFWKFPVIGVEKALADIGHFGVSVDYLHYDQHSSEEFVKLSRDLDIAAYDGLLFAPVFDSLSRAFVQDWMSTGKPCILFNSNISGADSNGFIGQDAYQSGYLGGSLMSYGLAPGRDLLLVNLSLRKDNYRHIIKRENGFRSFFEEHSDRVEKLVSLDVNGSNYVQLKKELNRKLSDLDVAGIFVTNSRVHLVAQYLAEQEIKNVRLIGYDLLPRSVDFLKRECIDFLISQSPEEQSYMGLKQLVDLVVLKQNIRKETLLPIDILTKENIDHYLNFNTKS